MRAWWKIDSRIAASLKEQKGPIIKGLACVALSALLTTAMIPLINQAVNAIGDASALGRKQTQEQAYEKVLAEGLQKPQERVREVLVKFPSLPRASDLSRELNVPEARVEEVLRTLVTEESPEEQRMRQTNAVKRLGWVCLGVIGLFLLKYWFTRGQAYFLSEAANRLAADLRLRLFSKLQRLPISYFGKQRVGAIQSVLTNDVSVYQTAVTLIRDSIDGPFKAIGALVAIFMIQWQLALVALLFVPVLAWLVQRNGQKMKRDQAQVQDDLAELNAFTNEALNGVRVVKAFAAERQTERLFSDRIDLTLSSQLKAARRFAMLRPMVELMGAASLATILYICGHMAQAGILQVGQIVAITFALDVINQGARSLSNLNNTYNQVQAAANRIYSVVLDLEEEHLEAGGAKVENPRGELEFRNVSFRYPDGAYALQNVSFVLAPGESLALVGPSGAGKSTLADLALRFYDPTDGQILLDGRDIRELDLRWYRGLFGVVPQQHFLFAGSIADNVRLGEPTANEEQVRSALQLAHALPFVERSEEGTEAKLGERGSRLSGGEGQRLAIARALVRDPKILLLDEATSNLDAESERAVTEALDEIMQTRTTIFIVHRLTTALRASRVVVLSRGQILESGRPQELLATPESKFGAMMKAFTGGLLNDTL